MAAIVLNGAAVAFVAYLIPGVEVHDLWTAIGVALVLTLATPPTAMPIPAPPGGDC